MQKVNYLFSTLHKYHIFITLNKNKAGNFFPFPFPFTWTFFSTFPNQEIYFLVPFWASISILQGKSKFPIFSFGKYLNTSRQKEVSHFLFWQVSQYFKAKGSFPFFSFGKYLNTSRQKEVSHFSFFDDVGRIPTAP